MTGNLNTSGQVTRSKIYTTGEVEGHNIKSRSDYISINHWFENRGTKFNVNDSFIRNGTIAYNEFRRR